MKVWQSLSLVSLSLALAAAQELDVDDADPSIVYTPASEWEHTSASASLDCYDNTFTFTALVSNRSDPTTPLALATATYTFPQPGTSFSWYGFQRSDGGFFTVCVDCQNGSDNVTYVDAYNETSNGSDPPVLLYSITDLPLGIHTFTIGNSLDSRVGMYGQITVDEFVIEGEASGSTSSAPSSAAGSMTSISSTVASTTTTTTSAIPTTTSTPSIAPIPSLSFPSAASSTTSHSTTTTQSTTTSPSSTPSNAAQADYDLPRVAIYVGLLAVLFL